MKRRLLRLVLLPLLALAVLPASGARQKDAGRPNILIIVSDDQGYADLGVQGCKDIPTPNIDTIAKSGTRFTSGYVSGPYCSPTRAGLMTGRYQTRFGHEFNPGPGPTPGRDDIGLSLDETTLPAKLKAAGYATGMVGKWHLGYEPKFHPMQRGFEEFFGFLGGSHPYLDWQRGLPILRGTEPVVEQTYLTDAFGREAVAYLDRHGKGAKPFFLYLAFNAVHNPEEATSTYTDRFPNIADMRRRIYAAKTSAMDDMVGKVLKKLRDLGIEENTVIAYFSDNGGPPVNGSLNTPLRGHKAQTLEGGVRVPYFLQWKGHLPAGKTDDRPVIQLDLHATALALAGLDPAKSPKPLDGVDLMPYLQGKKRGQPHEALYWRFGPQMAIRQGDWKLVRHNDAPDQVELYNLAKDIAESQNLAAAEPEKLKSLQAAWDKWNSEQIPPKWTASRRLAGE